MASVEDTAFSPATALSCSGKPAAMMMTQQAPWIMDPHYPTTYNIAQDGVPDVSVQYWAESHHGIQWHQV